MTQRLRVEVDHDLCYGSGNCVHHAQGAFELDEEGLVTLVNPDGADDESLRLAARDCPSGAIQVFDDSA